MLGCKPQKAALIRELTSVGLERVLIIKTRPYLKLRKKKKKRESKSWPAPNLLIKAVYEQFSTVDLSIIFMVLHKLYYW